jgi:hypothetical protein
MGAKVASLPSNRIGMRYRSFKNGAINEIILCERGGVYGRLRRKCPDGTYSEVVDITDAALQEGYDNSIEWTEVVLLGNSQQQNTVTIPTMEIQSAIRNGLQPTFIIVSIACPRE